jgi:four helix bundle protein
MKRKLNHRVSYLASSSAENGDWSEAGLLRENGDPLKYDLEERSARFGEAIIRFAKKIPRGPDNDRLIGQLVGAATSLGANYCEADDAVSKKDFRCKIGIGKKEARETKFFLRMVAAAEESLKPEARVLWQEAKELHLIFCAIWRK